MNKPVILAICGKSASGKDTLARELFSSLKEKYYNIVHKVVSDTTRKQRINEKWGIDYNFISKECFLAKKEKGYYIESSKFNNQYYGIPFTSLNLDGVNIIIVNTKGLKTLIEYQYHFDIIPIYIKTDFKTRLQRSINREQKFRIEYLRRAIVDYFNFLNIDKILNCFKYNIILDNFETTASQMHFISKRLYNIDLFWAKFYNL